MRKAREGESRSRACPGVCRCKCTDEIESSLGRWFRRVPISPGRACKKLRYEGAQNASPRTESIVSVFCGRYTYQAYDVSRWTAVVQGAVIYGVEKTHHKNLKKMRFSQKSFGIVVDEVASSKYDEDDFYMHPLTGTTMARGQFAWLIRSGDLLLSEATEVAEKEFSRTFKASDGRRFELPVYMYSDEDDDEPPVWRTGKHGE